MTVAKLSAGDGYTYYISETVSADVRREAGQELGDYYLAHGNPPGVWTGSGISALGMDGEVTEAQMKALYGEGLHPDADRIIAKEIAAGATPQAARRAAQLGRRYMQFKMPEGPSLAEQTTAEVERFERQNHRSPDPEEHRLIRTRVAAVAFRRDYGRDAGTKEELARYISAKSKPARQAVAGYDLQFAPAKSVSTLWALGDDDTRRAVEAAHEAAIDRTLGWIEREATATRTGYNGVAQVDILGGLVATRFRHHDSRAGDPQLHDHVVIANKVRSRGGVGENTGEKWRTIDGRLLYRLSVAASEHYNAAVLEEVSTRLRLTVEEREVTPGKRPSPRSPGSTTASPPCGPRAPSTSRTAPASSSRNTARPTARNPTNAPSSTSLSRPPWRHAPPRPPHDPCPSCAQPGAKPPPTSSAPTPSRTSSPALNGLNGSARRLSAAATAPSSRARPTPST